MLQSLKTSYTQDISLLAHRGSVFWYVLLIAALLTVPGVLGDFTRQRTRRRLHLRHRRRRADAAGRPAARPCQPGPGGAFLGVGAYANAVLLAQGRAVRGHSAGCQASSAALRWRRDRPADAAHELGCAWRSRPWRSAAIVGTVFQKWTAVTGGFDGFAVADADDPRLSRSRARPASTTVSLVGAGLRALGFGQICCARRSAAPCVAIRDGEVSAQLHGYQPCALQDDVVRDHRGHDRDRPVRCTRTTSASLRPTQFDVLI